MLPGVPASRNFQRDFTADKELLLREAKDVSPGLTYGASVALAAIYVAWVLILAWGMKRLQPGPLVRAAPPVPQSA